jgi:hypothetical protein
MLLDFRELPEDSGLISLAYWTGDYLNIKQVSAGVLNGNYKPIGPQTKTKQGL